MCVQLKDQKCRNIIRRILSVRDKRRLFIVRLPSDTVELSVDEPAVRPFMTHSEWQHLKAHVRCVAFDEKDLPRYEQKHECLPSFNIKHDSQCTGVSVTRMIDGKLLRLL